MWNRIATGITLAVVLATPSVAQTYLPLAVGNHWTYDNEFGFHEEQVVVGKVELFGRNAFVIRYVNSVVNEGLENYWWSNAEGDLYLCGFYRANGNLGRVYDPPVLWLNAPLQVDKSWTTFGSVYEYPSLESAGSIALGLAVDSKGVVTVPAGSYESYGITQFIPRGTTTTSAAGLAADGTRLDAASGWVGPTYYSVGVGVVLYETYALASPPVPVAAASWGRIKSGYR